MQFGERKDITYNSNEWRTPPELFDKLNEAFHFNLDVACNSGNCLCEYGIYEDTSDALSTTWLLSDKLSRIFINPPYGRGCLLPWTNKIVEEYKQSYVDVIVALLPVDTSTVWFQENVFNRASVLTFIKGRVKYLPPKELNTPPKTPTFGSCIAVYIKENHMPSHCINTLQSLGHTIYNYRR